MANRPQGRQKRVSSGGGNAYRRGSGNASPRVGSGRPASSRPSSFSTSTSRPSNVNRASGTSNLAALGIGMLLKSLLKGKSSGKKLLIILALVLAAFLLFRMFGGGSSIDPGLDLSPSTSVSDNLLGTNDYTTVSTTQSDSGAHNADTSVSNKARDKYTSLQGGGKDTATVMVYMCATDLEANHGMATADLQEMLYADIADNVNVILETGGASAWKNKVMSTSTNQRYKVTSEGLVVLDKNVGKKSMVDPDTLSDFIQYCTENYPADRYMLVFWDHGGGSISGFGYDQHFPNDVMSLDEIGTALKQGGCKFDIIGFDACLMATFETALVLEPYADYMIASEETEPGYGWYYTDWLTALSKNTSISSVKLGKQIIDDYVRVTYEKTPKSQATLSLTDLAEMAGTVPESFTGFAASMNELIKNDQYDEVTDARTSAKEFSAANKLNQIDLIDFAAKLGTDEAKELVKALQGCIKYNRTSSNISNSNGLAIYFPYNSLGKVGTMLSTYEKIGIDSEYADCVRSFASLAAGGQAVSSGSGNLLGSLMGNLSSGSSGELIGSLLGGGSSSSGSDILVSMLTDYLSSSRSHEWVNRDLVLGSADFYAEHYFDASALQITEKNGQRVIALAEDQWDLVKYMEMSVYLDDGEGYIDLGLDNVYEYNDDGDLVMEYDGTWLAINGQVVCYRLISVEESENGYTIVGAVPALLNGQRVDLILTFDDENPYGVVSGAQPVYSADENPVTETAAKTLIAPQAGDTVDFLCDYYSYDGEYSNTYFLGEQITVEDDWYISNVPVSESSYSYQMCYRFTDIYGNQYWTECVE